jgi:hypothetical protein
MTQVLHRTNFNRSRLIRILSDLSIDAVAEAPQALADRLGQWLHVTDAITLFAALNPSARCSVESRSSAAGCGVVALREELARVRAALAVSIAAGDVFKVGSQTRIQLTLPTADTAVGMAVDFAPYRRHYLACQRDMAASIGSLRAKAREALSNCQPALRQLAELDAALDQALKGRERDLLATVPMQLEKRFHRLFAGHRQTTVEAHATDDPNAWLQPGGWLATFGKDMQDVLLAELDVRLQPVTGLIDAYSNEVMTQQ